MSNPDNSKSKLGKVYLVGAGPGDPGLLTLRGKYLLEKAEVVVYDYLANKKLLNHVPADAEFIYVGKKGGGLHAFTQEGINELLVERGLAGKMVVRLKGGDPFIFGRGAEEIEELVAAGVPFEVVPGVTSATAAATYAGIPITHRQYTASVAFITGHEDPTKEKSNVHWDKLATGAGTIVIFMGIKNLPNITQKLIENGVLRLQGFTRLGEVAHLQTGPQFNRSIQRGDFPQDGAQESRLAHAVGTNQAGAFLAVRFDIFRLKQGDIRIANLQILCSEDDIAAAMRGRQTHIQGDRLYGPAQGVDALLKFGNRGRRSHGQAIFILNLQPTLAFHLSHLGAPKFGHCPACLRLWLYETH